MKEIGHIFLWDGRLNRKKYFLLHLILVPMTALTLYVLYLSTIHVNSALATGICFLYFCLILWALVATQIKRLHDRNKSGNWILLFYGSVFFFLLMRVITYVFKHSNRRYDYLLLITIIPLLGMTWFGIETFLIKGSVGNNKYGRDLLE